MDPNSPWAMDRPLMPPLGLAFLAGMLRKNGYQVKILENTIEKKSDSELLEIVRKEAPYLVGISCLSVNYQPSIRIAKLLKQELQIPIVIGGPHATVLPETMQLPFIDYICVGEGEITLLELCDALRSGSPVENIPGIFHKASGKWEFTGQRELIDNLARLSYL